MKRIESTTSRTAEMTCVSRAASYLETDSYYHSDDYLSVRLLPGLVGALFRVAPLRKLFVQRVAPAGIYEYVIARTRYVDAAFKQALDEKFDQILLFGAGFDTRALRFHRGAGHTRIFELDAPPTQGAKIKQYQKRGLTVPPNVVFVAIDFDKESIHDKLDQAGFRPAQKSLFLLEGLLMYLEPESVLAAFRLIEQYAGSGSRIVFDYVQASVLRGEKTLYGEEGLVRVVSQAGEQWRFGFDPDEVTPFLAAYGFRVADHKDARELEACYFHDEVGRAIGRLNGTHCIVTAVRP